MKLLVTLALFLALVDLADLDIALTVSTDASNISARGSILVEKNGSYYPIAYYRRMFNHTDLRYSTIDHEILAIVDNLIHFKYMLLGRTFKLFTDYIPLTTYFTKTDSFPLENLYGCKNYISSRLVYYYDMLQKTKIY